MGANSHTFIDGKERIAANVRDLVDDVEALLRSTASYTGDELESARSRLNGQLDRARSMYRDLENSAVDSYRQATSHTDAYVHDNPWRAVGIAAAVGVLVGLLAVRR